MKIWDGKLLFSNNWIFSKYDARVSILTVQNAKLLEKLFSSGSREVFENYTKNILKEEKKASLDFFEEFPSQKYIDIPSFTNSADLHRIQFSFAKCKTENPFKYVLTFSFKKAELFR